MHNGGDNLDEKDSTRNQKKIFLDSNEQDACQFAKSMKQISKAEYDENNFRSYFQT